jgi:hypothetical protein
MPGVGATDGGATAADLVFGVDTSRSASVSDGEVAVGAFAIVAGDVTGIEMGGAPEAATSGAPATAVFVAPGIAAAARLGDVGDKEPGVAPAIAMACGVD